MSLPPAQPNHKAPALPPRAQIFAHNQALTKPPRQLPVLWLCSALLLLCDITTAISPRFIQAPEIEANPRLALASSKCAGSYLTGLLPRVEGHLTRKLY